MKLLRLPRSYRQSPEKGRSSASPQGLGWLSFASVWGAFAVVCPRAFDATATTKPLSRCLPRLHGSSRLVQAIGNSHGAARFVQFTGYGILALLLTRGWMRVAGTRTRLNRQELATQAASLGILCASAIGMLCEWGWNAVAGGSGSVPAVAVDTLGAATFALTYVLLAGRREDA